VKRVGTSQSGAVFSDCGKYRYRLWRCWNAELPRVCFILLNPSTADEIQNDPTIERQCRRVEQWTSRTATLFGEASASRFGSIEVVNGCAYRSTDPVALYEIDDPVGDDNGDAIYNACRTAIDSEGIIVCGWGGHLLKLGPHGTTLHDALLESLIDDFPLHALRLNSDGTPQHPLYLPYNLLPRKWIGGELEESPNF
jgi:hypothetical protein